MRAESTNQRPISRSLALLCVLLVAFTGLVQAVHVHPQNSRLSSHECSVCSVAHAGVVARAVYPPAPLFKRGVHVVLAEGILHSSDPQFTLHIRPPPIA